MKHEYYVDTFHNRIALKKRNSRKWTVSFIKILSCLDPFASYMKSSLKNRFSCLTTLPSRENNLEDTTKISRVEENQNPCGNQIHTYYLAIRNRHNVCHLPLNINIDPYRNFSVRLLNCILYMVPR